jgi:hypothetical protein
MPEVYDKSGRPKLWATIRCLVPGCEGERLVPPDQAERLAQKLATGITVRYYLVKLKCDRCGYHNASLAFHLAYPGTRPWDPPKKPSEGRRVFPHEGGGAILDDSQSKLHRDLPVLVKGRGSQRKTK